MPQEPPFVVLRSPYGGFGLRSRSSETARRRVDGLLADCAVEVAMKDVSLSVSEPAPRALVEAELGPMERNTASRGGHMLRVSADELRRAHGHELGAPATEAWAAWGEPNQLGARQRKGEIWIEWEWTRRAPDATPLYDPWCRFLDRHQALMYDDYSPAIGVRATWELRLTSSSGAIVEPPHPPSRIIAHLSGRHASAFLDLVFFAPEAGSSAPYDELARVGHAMGMALPPASLRLSTPTRTGGRKLTKLH